MNAEQVKKCSEQLKMLLAEHHNALDAGVRKKVEEVIEVLDVAAAEKDESGGTAVLLSVTNLLRAASNIADLISRLGND